MDETGDVRPTALKWLVGIELLGAVVGLVVTAIVVLGRDVDPITKTRPPVPSGRLAPSLAVIAANLVVAWLLYQRHEFARRAVIVIALLSIGYTVVSQQGGGLVLPVVALVLALQPSVRDAMR